MGQLELQHEAHKARLARMGGRRRFTRPGEIAEQLRVVHLVPDASDPIRYRPIKQRAGTTPWPHNYYWGNMWFWDLVSLRRIDNVQRSPIERIIQVVSKYYDVTPTDIKSARRTAAVVLPRQVVMYLARKLTLKSLPQIGLALGGKDHTTVLYGIERITRRLGISPELRGIIEVLEKELASA